MGLTSKHYAAIGAVAANWSALERLIDSAIWRFAKIPNDEAGACITSQIYTIDGRLKALISILKWRKLTTKKLSALNAFANDMRGLAEQRNRIVHDPWVGIGQDPWRENPISGGSPHRFQVTAQRTLVMDYTPMPTSEVEKVADRISAAIERLDEIVRFAIHELDLAGYQRP